MSLDLAAFSQTCLSSHHPLLSKWRRKDTLTVIKYQGLRLKLKIAIQSNEFSDFILSFSSILVLLKHHPSLYFFLYKAPDVLSVYSSAAWRWSLSSTLTFHEVRRLVCSQQESRWIYQMDGRVSHIETTFGFKALGDETAPQLYYDLYRYGLLEHRVRLYTVWWSPSLATCDNICLCVYVLLKGEEHYNCISALHKSMRGSHENASLYWLGRMLEGGEDPLYVARRLVRFASEDVGMWSMNYFIISDFIIIIISIHF